MLLLIVVGASVNFSVGFICLISHCISEYVNILYIFTDCFFFHEEYYVLIKNVKAKHEKDTYGGCFWLFDCPLRSSFSLEYTLLPLQHSNTNGRPCLSSLPLLFILCYIMSVFVGWKGHLSGADLLVHVEHGEDPALWLVKEERVIKMLPSDWTDRLRGALGSGISNQVQGHMFRRRQEIRSEDKVYL